MNKSKFKIVCPDDLLKKIEDHCFSQTRTEVGGFLVGEIKDDQSIVTHIIKAKHTVAQMTQLTFTHKTWDAAFAEKDKIKPDAELIGWFHSHPNFGVFLSDHDKFIQTQFFAQDGKVTIVVDPIKGKRGWFISQDKEVIAYAKEEDTFIEKLGLSDSDSDENMMVVSSSNKGTGIGLSKVVAIAGIFSLFSMIGGFVLANSTNNAAKQIANLEREISVINFILDSNGLIPLTQNPNTPDPTPTKPTATPNPSGAKASKSPSTPSKSPSPSKSALVCYKGTEVKTVTGGTPKCPAGFTSKQPGTTQPTATPAQPTGPAESPSASSDTSKSPIAEPSNS